MRKDNPAAITLIPSPGTMLRTGVNEAELNRLVQTRVAEILADRDAFVFEPFFRSRQIAYELRRLQTVPEQRKWSVYFERYGCLICESRKRIHAGNGMCGACYARTFSTLKQIIAEGMTGEEAQPSSAGDRTRGLLPVKVYRHWQKRRARKGTASGAAW
jgi:hypothetical protein